ncbi:benzoate para-hydroxylase [Crepidotus variabilis]|uniref:Benzoate para-hydroxylase n=1 Tax=Crepidotus variabilis TaxID=179855 RepID=A0A9P6JJA7_9AGAR|nr:benzoate para-hydroxylase [Crepidotus variabilis]
MDSSFILLLGATSLLAALVLSGTRRLKGIPGPLLARWSPIWLFYHARIGQRYLAVHKAHLQYGRMVRISRNQVSINDANAIPVIYGHGAKAFLKSDYYHSFVAGTPSVFSTIDKKDHARKRMLASHAFSIRSLQSLAPFVHDIVLGFATKMDTVADAGEWIDTMKWFNFLAWDVISDLAFGEAIGFVPKASDLVEVLEPSGKTYSEKAIHVVDCREHLASVIGTVPWIRRFSKFVPDPFFVRGQKSATGITLIARERVEKRINSGGVRDDLLDKLISARMKETGSLNDAQITELTAEAVTILIAGSHTAAASTAAILHLLVKEERVYKALMKELLHAFGENEVPTYEQLKDLPYLQATITEGLRFHGTNAIGLPRIVPEGGMVWDGHFIPQGTEVSVPSWTLQHTEEYWGDPFTFRPERWLENPELRKYNLTFGAGSRTCLGKHIVNMEMLLVLSTFLLRYNVELKSPVMKTVERFQHEPEAMVVKITRRCKI